MPDMNTLRVAKQVLQHGHPYKAGWYDDGTPESGPSGGTTYGFRWGRLHLYLSRNGSVLMSSNGVWGTFDVVYNSCGFVRETHHPDALLVKRTLNALRTTLES